MISLIVTSHHQARRLTINQLFLMWKRRQTSLMTMVSYMGIVIILRHTTSHIAINVWFTEVLYSINIIISFMVTNEHWKVLNYLRNMIIIVGNIFGVALSYLIRTQFPGKLTWNKLAFNKFWNLLTDAPELSDTVIDSALETVIGGDADLPGFVVSWPSLPQYNNSCSKWIYM